MKTRAILCVSDLHITKETSDTEDRVLVDKLKKAVEGYEIKHILILGDVTNTGNGIEFQRVEKIIESLMGKLAIEDKTNICVIPGNHDINWYKYQYDISEESVSPSNENVHTYHNYKLQAFKKFYDKFYEGKKSFTTGRAITEVFLLKELQLAFLGINTLWKESYLEEDHYGFIDYQTLQDDLNEIKDQIDGYTCIAIMHHMPNYINEKGSFDIRNWKQIAELFNSYNIHIFIGGHAHTSQSHSIRDTEENYYLLTGSLSLSDKEITNSFLLLEEGTEEGDYGLYVKYFGKMGGYGHTENWYWQELTNKPDTIKYLPLQNSDKHADGKETGGPFEVHNYGGKKTAKENKTHSNYLVTAQEIVMNVLKEQKLFQSGHFHWSLEGRSHSYIKTNYYFENHECLQKMKIYFFNLIENNLSTDLLIGYAMQGNVLGSVLAAPLKLKYTYMPELNKKHPPYEKELPIIDGCKCITIIIDLVYTQHIIRQIIDRLKEKYPDFKVLNVCSIFYADNCKYNVNGYRDVNVKFYFIAEVDLNRCPYNKENELTAEDCIIFVQKLDTVHELFDKDEVGK